MANSTHARSNGQAHKRPKGSGILMRSIAVDKDVSDKMYNLAAELGVTCQILATKALESYLNSPEANHSHLKKIALRARAEQLMNEIHKIDREIEALDKPTATHKRRRRRKGQHNRDTPRYTNGFAVDGSSQAAHG